MAKRTQAEQLKYKFATKFGSSIKDSVWSIVDNEVRDGESIIADVNFNSMRGKSNSVLIANAPKLAITCLTIAKQLEDLKVELGSKNATGLIEFIEQGLHETLQSLIET